MQLKEISQASITIKIRISERLTVTAEDVHNITELGHNKHTRPSCNTNINIRHQSNIISEII